MIAMRVVLAFAMESAQICAAYFIAKKGAFQIEVGGSPFVHLLDDFNEKIKLKSLQDRTAVLQGKTPSSLAPALRLSPEYFNKLVSYFEYLDTNHDMALNEIEFMQVADYDKDLQKDGRHAYDLFSVADGKPGMTLQEFVRLVAVVTKVPGGFDYRHEDLKAIPASTVAEDQDRDAFMRLFAVFDENTSGDVDKTEFGHAWMGPTLWTLREKNILSERWLVSNAEFEYAQGEFGKSAGPDNVLSFGEFAHLLKDAIPHRGDHNSLKGGEIAGPKQMIGFSHNMPTLTAFLITFTVGALMSSL